MHTEKPKTVHSISLVPDRGDHFFHLWLGKTIANAAQDSLALHYCNGTLLAMFDLSTTTPQILLCKVDFPGS